MGGGLIQVDPLDETTQLRWFEVLWADQAGEDGYRIEKFDEALQQWVLIRDMPRNAGYIAFDVRSELHGELQILDFDQVRIRAFRGIYPRTYGPATVIDLYDF